MVHLQYMFLHEKPESQSPLCHKKISTLWGDPAESLAMSCFAE